MRDFWGAIHNTVEVELATKPDDGEIIILVKSGWAHGNYTQKHVAPLEPADAMYLMRRLEAALNEYAERVAQK